MAEDCKNKKLFSFILGHTYTKMHIMQQLMYSKNSPDRGLRSSPQLDPDLG